MYSRTYSRTLDGSTVERRDPIGIILLSPPSQTYQLGLAIVRGVLASDAPARLTYDPRLGALVGPGHRLPELRRWAPITACLSVARFPTSSTRRCSIFAPPALINAKPSIGGVRRVGEVRSCSPPALARRSSHFWQSTSSASAHVACIVAPTRALVAQWLTQLAEAFGIERVGAWYGNEKEVRPITVTTYHSAFTLLERWGTRFELLVLDEVHHLADTRAGDARAWHDPLRIAPAAYRLGLTATYPDGHDSELNRLVGPVVYRRTIGEMSDVELARFALVRRYVRLSSEEEREYAALTETYERHVEMAGHRERAATPADAWRMFAASARRSPPARRALRAFHERERLVRLAEGKLRETGRILRMHPAERAVIVCGGTDAAMAVSRAWPSR